MITGDSHQKVIPPTRSHVKAGFVVFSPDSKKRNIVILDKGELAAVERLGGIKNTIFKMHPGDLVGVAALLEREPFKYTIEATEDSTITVVTEECMESELKTLPVWLLAVIKSLSSKTRKFKEALYKPRCENTLKSLAEYCSHLNEKKPYSIGELVREFHWLTKIPEPAILEDLKALGRRKFIVVHGTGGKTEVQISSALLLRLFADYQKAQDQNVAWPPFQLSLLQKKLLVKISTIDHTQKKDAPGWIAFFEGEGLKIDVGEWIKILHLGWFAPQNDNLFTPSTDKVKYFLAALRFETNIKGVL